MVVVSSCCEVCGSFLKRAQPSSFFVIKDTAKENLEEGEDDVKSAWSLWIGLNMCYNGIYKESQSDNFEPISKKYPSPDFCLQLDKMKLELLVLVDQQRYGEFVLELCTYCPSRHGNEPCLIKLN
jgi:hypothetical protein